MPPLFPLSSNVKWMVIGLVTPFMVKLPLALNALPSLLTEVDENLIVDIYRHPTHLQHGYFLKKSRWRLYLPR